jgi:hypothetical protein
MPQLRVHHQSVRALAPRQRDACVVICLSDCSFCAMCDVGMKISLTSLSS